MCCDFSKKGIEKKSSSGNIRGRLKFHWSLHYLMASRVRLTSKCRDMWSFLHVKRVQRVWSLQLARARSCTCPCQAFLMEWKPLCHQLCWAQLACSFSWLWSIHENSEPMQICWYYIFKLDFLLSIFPFFWILNKIKKPLDFHQSRRCRNRMNDKTNVWSILSNCKYVIIPTNHRVFPIYGHVRKTKLISLLTD